MTLVLNGEPASSRCLVVQSLYYVHRDARSGDDSSHYAACHSYCGLLCLSCLLALGGMVDVGTISCTARESQDCSIYTQLTVHKHLVMK